MYFILSNIIINSWRRCSETKSYTTSPQRQKQSCWIFLACISRKPGDI